MKLNVNNTALSVGNTLLGPMGQTLGPRRHESSASNGDLIGVGGSFFLALLVAGHCMESLTEKQTTGDCACDYGSPIEAIAASRVAICLSSRASAPSTKESNE